jgi:dCTP deaminase
MGCLPDWAIKRDVKITPFEDGIKRDGKISFGCGSYGYDARIGYKFKIFTPVNCTIIDPKSFDDRAFVERDYTPKYEHQWQSQQCFDSEHKLTNGLHCNICGAWKDTPSEYKTQCPITQPDHILIPPHSFILGESIEVFEIPRDVLCIVLGKSTYARCGLIVNVTPGEPEWIGKWTIEISNTTHLPAKVYCGEGIMQCIFLRTDGYTEEILNQLLPFEINKITATCKVSYKDKLGKYQNQIGLTLPKAD